MSLSSRSSKEIKTRSLFSLMRSILMKSSRFHRHRPSGSSGRTCGLSVVSYPSTGIIPAFMVLDTQTGFWNGFFQVIRSMLVAGFFHYTHDIDKSEEGNESPVVVKGDPVDTKLTEVYN